MTCLNCKKEIVPNSGFRESKILIVRNMPHETEYASHKSGRFRSPTTPLSILRDEFFILGVDFVRIRKANLWQHKSNKSDFCFGHGKDALLEEAKGKQAILLCGANVVEYFTDYPVSTVSGLQVESNQLSAPIIYASVDPSTAMSKMGVGEIRFSVQNFVKKLIEEDIL